MIWRHIKDSISKDDKLKLIEYFTMLAQEMLDLNTEPSDKNRTLFFNREDIISMGKKIYAIGKENAMAFVLNSAANKAMKE